MRAVIAAIVSLGGTAMVFGLLFAMNADAAPPVAERGSTAIEVKVAPKPKPPKRKPAPKPRPREAQPRPTAPPPPMPAMGGGLTAVSLGMPTADTDFDAAGASALLGDVRASVMTEDAVDSKPKPMRRTAAAYPPRARAKGVTGSVTMSLLIGPRGEVERIKVLRADPPGIFDQAAQEAVRSWQFEPAMYGGEPVKVWANQTIRFELK